MVPLEPVGLSAADARNEEAKVRAALAELSGVCVLPRSDSAAKLRAFSGHRVPACEDAACRSRVATAFGADWLYSGTAFGLGGGRTVTLQLWNAQGTVVQRGSFATGEGVSDEAAAGTVVGLLRDARLGRSAVADANVVTRRGAISRLPAFTAGALAVAAVGVGAAFGVASQQTAERVAQRQTGCAGTGDAYVQCFNEVERGGRQQAALANVFFGAGALLGAGATVMFVMEWP